MFYMHLCKNWRFIVLQIAQRVKTDYLNYQQVLMRHEYTKIFKHKFYTMNWLYLKLGLKYIQKTGLVA